MREMETKIKWSEKKKKTLAYIGLLAAAGLLVLAVLLYNMPDKPDRAVTRGGDEVIFNTPEGSGIFFFWNTSQRRAFETVSPAEHQRLMEKSGEKEPKAVLPENAKEAEQTYRYALDEDRKRTGEWETVWTWETPLYPDPRADFNQVSGRQQDRGYGKMVLYKGERPLGGEIIKNQAAIDLEVRKSKVNDRILWVIRQGSENSGCSDPGRDVYEANIIDAAGDGFNVYLEAENVSVDYFLNLLEIATGGKDMSAEIPLISSGKGDSKAAIEKEKARREAEMEVWEREEAMILAAQKILKEEWAEEAAAGYAAGDAQRYEDQGILWLHDCEIFDEPKKIGDKAYNFKCCYDVSYPCDRKSVSSGLYFEITRYMMLEKDEEGSYVETGMPYIEIDDSELEQAETSDQQHRLRYTSPSQCPYVAKIDKTRVKGKSREEISLLLLRQLGEEMSAPEDEGPGTVGGSYMQTRNRTFRITACKDLRVVRIHKTGDKKRWIVKGDFNWKYVGYTDTYGYMGAAFPGYSREGWIARFDQDNRFVLQEKADCYTLETMTNYEMREK